MDFKHIKAEAPIYQCPYNKACACQKRQCAGCGWNPAVALERTQVIMQRRLQEAQHG